MKVYISLDMEGVSGLVRWEYVAGEFAPYVGDVTPYSLEVELKNYLSDGLRQTWKPCLNLKSSIPAWREPRLTIWEWDFVESPI